MSCCNDNKIVIIVPYVIILECLSARFVHTGALQVTDLTFFNTSYNIGKAKAKNF